MAYQGAAVYAVRISASTLPDGPCSLQLSVRKIQGSQAKFTLAEYQMSAAIFTQFFLGLSLYRYVIYTTSNTPVYHVTELA